MSINDMEEYNQFFQIETILWNIVSYVNKKWNGDGCSIFLREEGTNRFILQDSTKMTPFLGNDFFSVKSNDKPSIQGGLTRLTVITGLRINVPDVRECKYWSNYGSDEKDLKETPQGACELPHHIVRRYLGVPLKIDNNVFGVLRVVRSSNKGAFEENEAQSLEDYIQDQISKISGANSISYLLDMGSILDLKSLCTRFTSIIKDMIDARGCSIYIFSEEKNNVKLFRCYGTTGLWDVRKNKSIENPELEALYKYDPDEKIPKHITTAVIKYGINYISSDLRDFSNDQFYQETRKPIDRKKAKYWEIFKDRGEAKIVAAGPSIFLPLFTPSSYPIVFGVININRPENTKEFSPTEIRYCLSLSQRLSKILLFSKFLHLLNKPIDAEDSENLEESFTSLMDQICLTSGSPKVTLFKKIEKKLIEISFGDKEKIIYEVPSQSDKYGKSDKYKGFTTWVATFNEPLRFNDPEDITTNWNSTSPPPIHSGKGECEVADTPPSRFLGVPISIKKEVLGVLRTAKTADDQPFSENEEILFKALADRLAPVLKTLNNLEFCKNKMESELELIFSPELISKVKSIAEESEEKRISPHISEFLLINPKNSIDLNNRVLKSTRALWSVLWEEQISIGENDKLLPLFNLFNEKILNELPGYRDHFIHQYQVFLLGYYIIEKLKSTQVPFHEAYAKTILLEEPLDDQSLKRIADLAWLVTSTFHDIAFPLQKINQWLPNMVEKFLGEESKWIIPEIPIELILFDEKGRYFTSITELNRYLVQMNLIPGIDDDEFYQLFLKIVRKKDHGVLSALILAAPQFPCQNEIIIPASLAIAFHKKLLDEIKSTGTKISFEQFPLLFLLLYCDLVQEWGRDPEDKSYKPPTLKKIIATKDIGEIRGGEQNIPQYIQNKNPIYIHSEIFVKNGREKIEECESLFKTIKSENPFFCITVNSKFFPSKGKK